MPAHSKNETPRLWRPNLVTLKTARPIRGILGSAVVREGCPKAVPHLFPFPPLSSAAPSGPTMQVGVDSNYSAAATTFFFSARVRSNSRAINAERLRADDTTMIPRPNGSRSSPNASGASACAIREGAPISPSRHRVVLWSEVCQWQRPPRDRENAVASPMQQREGRRGAAEKRMISVRSAIAPLSGRSGSHPRLTRARVIICAP